MPRTSSPQQIAIDMWSAGFQAYMLMVETQTVMGLRIMGFAGYWPLPRDESSRMFLEKGPAWTAAAMAAGMGTLSGQPPDKIAKAAIRPLRSKTRSNAKRLSSTRRRKR
ncbi:MAG: antifreeze protein [Pseudomonadota bacterium]